MPVGKLFLCTLIASSTPSGTWKIGEMLVESRYPNLLSFLFLLQDVILRI